MKLENACLCVEIAEKGAELTRIFNKKTGAEILWNGNPEFWNRHSPILFPNVGKTHGNTVLIKGTQSVSLCKICSRGSAVFILFE